MATIPIPVSSTLGSALQSIFGHIFDAQLELQALLNSSPSELEPVLIAVKAVLVHLTACDEGIRDLRCHVQDELNQSLDELFPQNIMIPPTRTILEENAQQNLDRRLHELHIDSAEDTLDCMERGEDGAEPELHEADSVVQYDDLEGEAADGDVEEFPALPETHSKDALRIGYVGPLMPYKELRAPSDPLISGDESEGEDAAEQLSIAMHSIRSDAATFGDEISTTQDILKTTPDASISSAAKPFVTDPPQFSFIPFLPTALSCRQAALEFRSHGGPVVSIMGAVSVDTPCPPGYPDSYRTGSQRRARQIELRIPNNRRLDTLVVYEPLGDLFDEVAYKHLLLPDEPAGDSALTEETLRAALNGSLAKGGGNPITEDGCRRIWSAQVSMRRLLQFAREADAEFFYRRVPGEILTEALNCLPGVHYFMRSGSSSLYQAEAGDSRPAVHAIPDIDDVYVKTDFQDPGDDLLEPSISSAAHSTSVEIKTKSLRSTLTTKVLRIQHNDLDGLATLMEQRQLCPGFGYRYIWPDSTVYIGVEDQLIVQIYTSMFFKEQRLAELSNGYSSVFFYRPSLESTTLYMSRMYTTPGTKGDQALDGLTNITRFALRYIAIYDELLERLDALVPPAMTKHWKTMASSRQALVGVDRRSSWTLENRRVYYSDRYVRRAAKERKEAEECS